MNNKDLELINKFSQMLAEERLSESENGFYIELGQTKFENDYTRMIMAAPTRRLQDKAQVFPLDRTDFTRTRLTHSLEVSDIAKQIGAYVENLLVKKYGKEIDDEDFIKKHYIPQILQVAGLIHDIGNPPYGHYGEQAIKDYFNGLATYREQTEKLLIQLSQKQAEVSTDDNTTLQSLMLLGQEITLNVERKRTYTNRITKAFSKLTEEQRADLQHFDGNVQDIRVLTHLGLSNDDHSFNLTAPVLATIIKYPFSAIDGNKEGKGIPHMQSKFGYFDSEKEEYEKLLGKIQLKKNKRYPLTYLLEAADDITYSTCDLEDGYRLGIITVRDITRTIEQTILDQSLSTDIKEKLNSILDRLITCEQNNSFQQTEEEECIQELRIILQQYLIRECAHFFVDKIDEIMKGDVIDELLPCTNAQSLVGNFKELAAKNFSNYGVIKSELLGGTVIATLMNAFTQALFDPQIVKEKDGKIKLNTKTRAYKLYSLISPNYKRIAMGNVNECDFLQDNENQYAYQKFQLVTDFIAGMTDKFALQLYYDLVG